MLELMGSVKQVTHSPWKKEGHNWSLNVFKRIFKCPQRGQFGYDFSSAESLSCVQLFVSPGNTPGYLVHHQLPEFSQDWNTDINIYTTWYVVTTKPNILTSKLCARVISHENKLLFLRDTEKTLIISKKVEKVLIKSKSYSWV